MTASRAPLLATRLSGRRARLLNFLTGAAIALGLADIVVLTGVRLSSPVVGTVVLPLATAVVAAGLATTRLLWSRGDRMMWMLLAAGLLATVAGGIVFAITAATSTTRASKTSSGWPPTRRGTRRWS